MSLEAEIKNLTGAMTRLAEGVEKLLSISQPVQHSGTVDMLRPTYAPPQNSLTDPTVRNTNSNVDGAKIERLAAEVQQAVAATTAAPRKSETPEPAGTSEAPQASEASSGGAEVVAPTFEDAKRAFLAIAQKYDAVEGTKLSKNVLQRYGVPNLKALSAEQYADFIELCGTVVAGGEV